MSGTQYSRDRTLRMTGDEQALLAGLVMAEVESLSHALNAAGGGTEPRKRRLRDLRSLLERLSQ